MLRGPRGTARQDTGLQDSEGVPRGGVVEVEVSCISCWSVQLFPPDRAGGQCHGDSTLTPTVNNSTFVRGQ